jgi:hypothetical protein
MKLILALALCCLAVLPAHAQDRPDQDKADQGKALDATESAGEPNPPGIGEIMREQQMRHIKLWLAGHAGNWPLADYELDELKEGFDDVGRQVGEDFVKSMIGAPLGDLEKAIDARNEAAFAAAYDRLSSGCNSCHRTLGHGFIVIQRPTGSPYPDQSFAPQKQ